jgi:hypothetical protein
MEEEDAPTLQFTYEEFVAVLRKLDAYTQIEFSEMSRGFPVITGSDEDFYAAFGGGPRPAGHANTTAVKLSDLAGLIWKSLGAGADEVDRLHDEVYVSAQVEHFKKTYASPEHVASQMVSDWGGPPELPAPTALFFKLGKPARMLLMAEGFLEEAIKAYEQGEEIVRNKEERERIERSRKRQQEKLVIETRKRVRELDGLQCVFCGARVTNNPRYVMLSDGDYLPENVVLSCAPCHTKIRHKVPEAAEMAPTHGRFADPEIDTGEVTRVM